MKYIIPILFIISFSSCGSDSTNPLPIPSESPSPEPSETPSPEPSPLPSPVVCKVYKVNKTCSIKVCSNDTWTYVGKCHD